MIRIARYWCAFALLSGLLLAIPQARADFSACRPLFPGDAPPADRARDTVDLCKTVNGDAIFAVRFDTGRKTPAWTAHTLTPRHLALIDGNAGSMRRPRFVPDPDLAATDQAVDKSYVRSSYSRGHMVPANDMSWNRDAYDATFRFSNVVPQLQHFNAGTWLGAEDAVRDWVRGKQTTLWIISGVYGSVQDDTATPEHEGTTIGNPPNAPVVPKCYYKIIVAKPDNGPQYKGIALLFAWNDGGRRNEWRNAVTTLDILRARAGLTFLDGANIETTLDTAYWGVDRPSRFADCI